MASSNFTPDQIEDFVVLAQNGDADAFAKIYDHFIDQIYRYIFFRVKKDEALDLAETVFLKVWENLKSYKHGEHHFSSWIFRIAHNLVVDHYRLNREYAELDHDLPDENELRNPKHQLEQKLSQETLQRAILKLKKNYQQVLLLKYINDLENHEIAKILGRSEGNLRILKFRALQALKKVLEGMNITY